ncbi:MAG: hypothetical protein H6R14_2348, partial [Proteobacteria bacterium]|nr:hypothetical protein [Pseudomonadota bacterium]
PPQPPAQKVPTLQPVVEPPKVLPPQKVPMLVPQQPPAQQTPTPQPVGEPPKVLPPQQVPMLVPPQPPAQQTPTPQPVVEPPKVLPPQQVPMLVPPLVQTKPTYKPRPQRPGIPPVLVGVSGQGPNGQVPPSHQLAIHEPNRPMPVTSGDHQGAQVYSFEFIEPGIQNHKVEVYRSRDAQEVIYKDTIPMDAGGFHLRVIGIRNPDYSN